MEKLTSKVRDWYLVAFPTDDLGEEISEKLTFKGVIGAINKGKDVYDVIPGDSLVRERIFEKISEITNQPYDNIYESWLGNGTPKFVA